MSIRICFSSTGVTFTRRLHLAGSILLRATCRYVRDQLTWCTYSALRWLQAVLSSKGEDVPRQTLAHDMCSQSIEKSVTQENAVLSIDFRMLLF